jgi:hypothetical protein
MLQLRLMPEGSSTACVVKSDRSLEIQMPLDMPLNVVVEETQTAIVDAVQAMLWELLADSDCSREIVLDGETVLIHYSNTKGEIPD